MAKQTAAQKAAAEEQKIIDAQNAAAAEEQKIIDEQNAAAAAAAAGEAPEDGTSQEPEAGEIVQTTSEDTKATTIFVEPPVNPDASLNLESGEKTQSDDLIVAVTLRAIPGTIIKAGALIRAPESLVEKWYSQNWADNHESALREAQKDIESKLMANPHADVGSMIIELGKDGQPVEG